MPVLPTGTVTFLFTDIQGSTRLWEEQPETMRLALARHDALLRHAIESNGGYVFKTMGDAFCTAFHTAPEALHAAYAAQQALISEPWPAPVTIKVRMALHTGDAELRDNDYFGQPLNRVARLLATGHGEQILLSRTTEELIRDALPLSASLKGLGDHRLRDLNRPETIFQLLHPTLPAAFPPLNSLDHLRNNLPLQLTSFIGREKEMAEITNLLAKTRLLTLTGSGGCGKTRLSLQVAADVEEQYSDGVWLVELASLADPGLVPQTVALVLNLTEQVGRTYTQTLIDYLRAKRLLLVLDNCEHLLSACALFADAVLRACPQISIIASSREGLGIAGEHTYRVPSLSLPDPKQAASVESIGQYEAVQLFIDRALVYRADFAVTSRNAQAIASVCHQIDGIPLAIELAAARIRSFSVEEINTRLDNRFRLLTGGSKAALPRQQTLRALIDWSYDLLSVQEKTLLLCLSVFAGGWTLAAAEQVGSGESASGERIEDFEVLDLLTSLVDKSLVIAETQDDVTRYRLLETVRQYADEKRVEADEGEAARERHRDYFVALGEAAEPQLRGRDQSEWLARLEIEHDNLRAALEACRTDAAAVEMGLRLVGSLWRFWEIRGHLSEGRAHLVVALERGTAEVYRKPRIKALNGVGALDWHQGDYPAARAHFEQALAQQRELGMVQDTANTLNNMGLVAYEQGDYAAAKVLFEECLAVDRQAGEKDRHGIASSLHNLGNVAHDMGDWGAAKALHEESLAIRKELGDRRGIAYSMNNLALVLYDEGNLQAAKSLFEESLTLRRELGDRLGIANTLNNLSNLHLDQGDVETVRPLFEESLRIRQELGDRKGVSQSLQTLARLSQEHGLPERAVRMLAAADALRAELRTPLAPHARDMYERCLQAVREALGEKAFAAAWAEGQSMSLDQVITDATLQ